MLVLSRKISERIHIGDNIFVEVRKISGNRVTLALEAPKEVRILRGELTGAAQAFEEPESEEPPGEKPTDTYVITQHRIDTTERFPESNPLG